MSGNSRRSIPSWQREWQGQKSEGTEGARNQAEEADNDNIRNNDEDQSDKLTENAKLFLNDDTVRDAPTSQKREFLRSKGIDTEVIEKLLGKSTEEITAGATEGADIHSLSTDSNAQSQTTKRDTTETVPRPHAADDIPPIITYPEFLLHAQKPPPLITTNRLLTAGYILGGAYAAVYGASKYLASPMLESLSSARHSFFENTISNLDSLNEKLEGMVSVIPSEAKFPTSHHDDETSSVASDPAEMFHRDIGVQTSSPPVSPSSADSLLMSDTLPLLSSSKPWEAQAHQLARIRESLMDGISQSEGTFVGDVELNSQLTDMTQYLDRLNRYPGIMNFGSSGATGGRPKDTDAIGTLKAEIRSVKGVLLSARTFPAGGMRSRVGTW
ncbi:hypothetical protein MMC25_002759 [Agyrium rufum]|nr:hypothetical protein [Agyrium rufum]